MSKSTVNKETQAGLNIVKSACRMCHGGCGVLVYIRDNKVIKIKGDPESPLNRGRLCPKGRASVEHLYHPDRFKYPMKRKGKRGAGVWERISWDEALETVVSKIKDIRDDYGIESVAIGQGTGRHHFFHTQRFANALGTPNWVEPGFAQCFLPRVIASTLTYGWLPGCDYYGEVNPACLLIWGHNPLKSGPNGELQFNVRDCIKKGTKLIVIDPCQTELAEKAEIWLQIRPGTDDALALSLLNVIIHENLYDREFVENWTNGFEELAQRVKQYPPEWAEAITWIPAEKIRKAAYLLAATKPAGLEWGVGIEHSTNCWQTVRAISLLPAITGNIDIPGGWLMGMHIMSELNILLGDHLSTEMKAKRLGAETHKLANGILTPLPTAHIPSLWKAMRIGDPYPVKAFLMFGNNALVGYSESNVVYKSLMSLDFILSMDIYPTPTTEISDIVLPAATWLELDQLFTAPSGVSHCILAGQRVTRQWECRSDEEVFIDLARRLELTCGTEPLHEIFQKQLDVASEAHKFLKGMTFDTIKKKGFVTMPIMYKKYEKQGFATASGKVELAPAILKTMGYDALPYFDEPPESPYSTPEIAKEYPLILTNTGRSQYFFCTEHRQIESLRKHHQFPLVAIHPETAESHEINEGDMVWIETLRGRIQQKAKLTKGVDPRVVGVEQGWWFPEDPHPEHGLWKSNANVLTNSGPPYDPCLGTYQLRALLCKIYRKS